MILTIVSLLIAFLAIFGFLYYKEFQKKSVADFSLPGKPLPPDEHLYTNDYWGFQLHYPGSWYPVIGSYEEGNYYFSSEKINFLKEMDPDQAVIHAIPLHNLKNTDFSTWLTEQESDYFPYGKVKKIDSFPLAGFRTARYSMQPQKVPANMAYWDMIIVARDNKRIYEFVLKTSDAATHDRYVEVFESVVKTVRFYDGFGS